LLKKWEAQLLASDGSDVLTSMLLDGDVRMLQRQHAAPSDCFPFNWSSMLRGSEERMLRLAACIELRRRKTEFPALAAARVETRGGSESWAAQKNGLAPKRRSLLLSRSVQPKF
jgi:hypothetical protein